MVGLLLGGLVVAHTLRATGELGPSPAEKAAEGWSIFAQPAAKRDLGRAERLARQALDENPLQANAASLLAVVEELRGDKARTAALMKAAARLSRRDDIADFWLFNHYMEARRYPEAMQHADALLRRRFLVVSQQVYPRILMNFGDPALQTVVAQRLAKKPEWRRNFLHAAAAGFADPRAAFNVYSAIQTAGSPPTTAELQPYLGRLLADGKYEEAYLSWVLFLPQNVVSRLENIYDGDFEGWPETPPFGWNLSEGVRGSIESAAAYNREGSALRVDFDGRTAPKMPRQILILPAGNYRFSGQVLTASDDAVGRMQWTISCIAGPSLLPEMPVPGTRMTWKPFSAVFTVPEGCKGQWLELKAIPWERRANIEVWFDDLSIDRVDATS